MEISEFSLPPFPSISLYPNREQKDKTENFQRQQFYTTHELIYHPFINKTKKKKNKYLNINLFKKKNRTPSHRNRFPKQKKKKKSNIKIESISKEHSFLHEKVNFSRKTNRPK